MSKRWKFLRYFLSTIQKDERKYIKITSIDSNCDVYYTNESGSSKISRFNKTNNTFSSVLDEEDRSHILITVDSDTNNYEFTVFNFKNSTVTTYVTDYSSSNYEWSSNSIVQNKGFIISFYNYNTELTSGYILDVSGSIIESFLNLSNVNIDCIDGKYSTIKYVDNGVLKLKIFDGVTVYNKEFSNASVIDLYSDDGTSNDSTMCFAVEMNNSDINYYLFKDGVFNNFFTSYASDSYYINILVYSNANFITVYTVSRTNGTFQNFYIYDTSGNLVRDIDVSSYSCTYQSDITYYGTNKLYFAIYNSDKTMYLYNYNYEHDVVSTKTYTNSDQYNYNDAEIYSTNYPSYGLFNDINEDLLLIFTDTGSTQGNSASTNSFLMTNYCDFVYVRSGSTQFETYNYQNSNDLSKGIAFCTSSSPIPWNIIMNGDNSISILTIPNEPKITVLESFLPTDSVSYNWATFYNYISVIVYNYTNNTENIYLINMNGNIVQTINETIDNSSNCVVSYSSAVFIINSKIYYINKNMTEFTLLDEPFNDYTISYGVTSDKLYNGNILLKYVSGGSYYFRVLSNNGMSNKIIIENVTNYRFCIGDDVVLIVYNQNSGNYKIALYDLDLNLLNYKQTDYSSLYYTYMYGYGGIVNVSDGSTINVEYCITSTNVSEKSYTYNSSINYTINDYNYYDD